MAKPHHWNHHHTAQTAPVIGAYTITMTLTDKPIPQAARWHVLGAGAMGCLWACAIQNQPLGTTQLKIQVSLLLRDQAALAAYPGHVLCSDMNRATTMPAHAITNGANQIPESIENLLVATKAHDTVDAINTVAKQLTPGTRIVLLQNGLKVQREISRRFGDGRVFCLSTNHGAWLRAPFDVVHAGDGDAWLGQLTEDVDAAEKLQSLLSMLPAQQLNIRIDPDIATRLWQKLAINCAVNALTVIHDCRNGELLLKSEARQTLSALCDEISLLLQSIPDAPTIGDLQTQVHEVLTITADNLSSTLQDVRRGRRTEIDHLNGYLCELAAQHHLPCPVNKDVLRQMRMIESRATRAGRGNPGLRPTS